MGSELKIVLVDDDKIMLFLHEMFLKKSGILNETVLCYNGEDALNFLDANNQPGYHYLILLDINMPVMNGWDFLSALNTKTFTPKVWVIMVSSATEEVERDRAFTFPQVIDYLQKPLTLESCNQIKAKDELRSFFEG